MSMMLTLRRVSDADVTALRNDPDTVGPLLRDIDGVQDVAGTITSTNLQNAIREVGRDTWTQYASGEADWALPMIAGAMLEYMEEHAPPEVSRPEYLDLDKSWHILHTLISGTPDQADAPSAALLGGEDVGPDGGYGPARWLTQERVAAFDEALSPLDSDALMARADPDGLAQQGVAFVPSGAGRDDIALEVEDYFPKLKKFVSATVRKKRGLLLFLN